MQQEGTIARRDPDGSCGGRKASRLLVLVFAALSAFCLEGTSSAADFNCEGCDLGGMRLQAEALGSGTHRIYSFANDLAFTFLVRCEGERPLSEPGPAQSGTDEGPGRGASSTSGIAAIGSCPPGQTTVVETLPLGAAEQHAFDLVKDFRWSYPPGQDGVAFEYTPSAGGGEWGHSVYNFLGNYPARSNLYDEIRQNAPAIPQYLNALAVAIGAHFNLLYNRLIIRVVFRDGSSIRIYFDGSLQTFHVIPESARSETNQPIVEQNDRDYAGRYNIAGTDIGAYLRFLEGMGVEVVGTRGAHSTCSWDPKNSRLTCRIW